MELKPPRFVIFPLLVFVLTMNTLIINRAAGQIPVKAGVVLDMDNRVGRMGLNCIRMALSDFYTAHPYYKTRLVLHIRDSKSDVVGAAAAAIDLLKNVEVQAIIGPLFSGQANFMINLGDKAQVPIITFAATSPFLSSIRSPYFVRAALKDSSQVEAIGAIIQGFGWREVVPIYADNEFGEGIMPSLTDALEQLNVRVPYRSVIPPSATDDQIDEELYKLMTMQTRVFVVHMLNCLGSRLFAKAKLLGMMSEDYVWIVTDGMTNGLKSIDPSIMESMLGVIGVTVYIPKTEELNNFTIRYKKKIQQSNLTAHSLVPDILGLWAYDSAIALALAVEKARVRNATYLKENISSKSTDLEGLGVSNVGRNLIHALSKTTFRGLAGKFELVKGQLQSSPYQIVNVVGPGARVVGYWTKEKGIVNELNLKNANTNTYCSRFNLRSIIWPGDKTSPPKGWVIPTTGKKLKIGIPVKKGFPQFMNVTWNPDNSTVVQGYCKDVFDDVVKALPYGVQFEYIPFVTPDHNSAGSYDDLVYQVYLKKFDAVVGDITILSNRSQYVDFTLPYTESGVSMVVPIKDDKSRKAWVFLKPLTWELWLTSFCSFVFIGFLIWILEHQTNEDFRGPTWHQVGMIFWFAFSTMVFAHKERVVSNLSRFVLIIWFLVVLILTQSYTASLASMLTVQQLKPTVTDINVLLQNNKNVGYQNGSFIFGLLQSIGFNESRLLAYNSPGELDQLLSNGSANGGIDAAFDEIPYLKLFLTNYCSKYIMVGPKYKLDGLGFVFPLGSPLVPDISRAILKVTERNKTTEIEKNWFGYEGKCQDASNLFSSNSLGLESFWGLFLIVGIASFSAFIIYVIKFLHQNWHVMDCSDPESTMKSKTLELLRRFNSKDLSYHSFKKTEENEKDHGCGCDHMKRIMEYSNEHVQSSPSSFSRNSPRTNGFSSPVAHDVQSPFEQNSALESKSTKPEGEEPRVIKQEIELVDPNQNQ